MKFADTVRYRVLKARSLPKILLWSSNVALLFTRDNFEDSLDQEMMIFNCTVFAFFFKFFNFFFGYFGFLQFCAKIDTNNSTDKTPKEPIKQLNHPYNRYNSSLDIIISIFQEQLETFLLFIILKYSKTRFFKKPCLYGLLLTNYKCHVKKKTKHAYHNSIQVSS